MMSGCAKLLMTIAGISYYYSAPLLIASEIGDMVEGWVPSQTPTTPVVSYAGLAQPSPHTNTLLWWGNTPRPQPQSKQSRGYLPLNERGWILNESGHLM